MWCQLCNLEVVQIIVAISLTESSRQITQHTITTYGSLQAVKLSWRPLVNANTIAAGCLHFDDHV